jgi:protease I
LSPCQVQFEFWVSRFKFRAASSWFARSLQRVEISISGVLFAEVDGLWLGLKADSRRLMAFIMRLGDRLRTYKRQKDFRIMIPAFQKEAFMSLTDKKMLILVDDLYEDLEVWYPYYRLIESGITVVTAGHEAKTYSSKHGYPMQASRAVQELKASDFNGVVIPGGYAPDRLRRYPEILTIVADIFHAGGVTAFICHGAWVPISAGIVKGRTATCFSAIKDDLINAGAYYEDKSVVVDGKMISSRKPDDLPDFLRAILGALCRKETG